MKIYLVKETKEEYIRRCNIKPINNYIDNKNNEKQLKINDLEESTVQFSFIDTLLDQYKIVGQIFNTYIVLREKINQCI